MSVKPNNASYDTPHSYGSSDDRLSNITTHYNSTSATLYDGDDDTTEDRDGDAQVGKTTAEKIRSGIFYTILSLAALYFFMVAVKLIGDGFTLALGCDTKGAFDFADNPVAGLMIGTVATALLHSSGTVTSIIVALVGAGGMTIRQGVYVIMGANVGTCVTCIMVAFGQVGDRARFQRAMAAATVHDMYNIWSVFVLFPIEVLFHPLEELSRAMSNAKASSGAFKSPVDAIVNPLTENLIVVDKSAIYMIVTGEKECIPGMSFVKKGAFKSPPRSASHRPSLPPHEVRNPKLPPRSGVLHDPSPRETASSRRQ